MKSKKLTAVIAATVMICVLFVCTVSPTAAAILSRNGSITLHITDSSSGMPVKDAAFHLYYIARAEESGGNIQHTLIPPYDKANISADNLQDSYSPIHLAHFASSRNLTHATASTDATGKAVFADLTPGLYLIVPADGFDGYLIPTPFVINIPNYNAEEKTWEYDVTATPKISTDNENPDDSTTYITVKKIWEAGNATPESIKVVLLCDLEEYATVRLSESNNWYYRWDKLEKGHLWSVVELTPDGYTASYKTSSNTVTIINKSKEDTETTAPTNPEKPPQGTTSPDEPATEEELIQTGQLNWPVPVLAVAGLVLFGAGWGMINLRKKDSE